MISKARSAIRSMVKALLSVVVLLPGCGGNPGVSESSQASAGLLELGLRASLEGVRYQLEARFAVSGPDSALVSPRPGEATLSLELAPGSYAVRLQPGYHVYQDQAVVLTAVDAELLSGATQAFEITPTATTRVEYRFVIAAGTLAFGGEELE